jgi:hypothetical protein
MVEQAGVDPGGALPLRRFLFRASGFCESYYRKFSDGCLSGPADPGDVEAVFRMESGDWSAISVSPGNTGGALRGCLISRFHAILRIMIRVIAM